MVYDLDSTTMLFLFLALGFSADPVSPCVQSLKENFPTIAASSLVFCHLGHYAATSFATDPIFDKDGVRWAQFSFSLATLIVYATRGIFRACTWGENYCSKYRKLHVLYTVAFAMAVLNLTFHCLHFSTADSNLKQLRQWPGEHPVKVGIGAISVACSSVADFVKAREKAVSRTEPTTNHPNDAEEMV